MPQRDKGGKELALVETECRAFKESQNRDPAINAILIYDSPVKLVNENSMSKDYIIENALMLRVQRDHFEKRKEQAVNIKGCEYIRKKVQATADQWPSGVAKVQATIGTIKGNCKSLSYEAEVGEKLFFHMSEVKGDGILQPGDKFVIIHHQRSGKFSACNVVKVGERQPLQHSKRLNSLNIMSTEGNALPLVLIRQSKGPDGSGRFKFL